MNAKHVVALSGGKDSTALALRLMETEPRDYEFIYNATGNELPEMRDHIKKLEGLLESEIKEVRHPRDLIEEAKFQKMLPSAISRWCTRILKIEPTIEYFKNLPKGSILYVGLRGDEEIRAGIYGDDVVSRFPMRDWGWGVRNVFRYLDSRGVCVPARTDCALCPNQRLSEWKELMEKHPEEYEKGVLLEKHVGATIRSPSRDTWPAGLEELAKEFKSGRILRASRRDQQKCRVCSL